MNMRYLWITLLALGTMARAQHPATHANEPVPQAVQVSIGEPWPQVTWYLPPGTRTAGFRVLRRRQYVGTAEERHCRTLFQTRNDSVFLLMVDTARAPQGILEYRIIPRDSAGVEGPPSDWATVSTLSGEVRPFATALYARSDTGHRSIRLTWQVYRPERVRSIRVYRADAFDGPYALIAERPGTDTVLLDPVQRVLEDLFYRVQVMDIFGPGAISVPVLALSNYRPGALPPILLAATPDSAGVTLGWQPQGTDIKGYFVQRRAVGDTSWRTVSGLVAADTLHRWKDTTVPPGLLHAWRLVAVSTGDRKSGPSDFVMAMRPDPGMPPPPDGLVARRRDAGRVTISWRPPLLGDAIISGYRVERSTDGGNTFNSMDGMPVPEGGNLFIDSTASAGALAYRVRSIGPAGQVGVPGAVARVDAVELAAAPRELLARITGKGVQLQWPATERGVKSLRVYRSDGKAEPQRIAELPPSSGGWLDTAPLKGTQFYLVRALLPDGTEGEMSKPVMVGW